MSKSKLKTMNTAEIVKRVQALDSGLNSANDMSVEIADMIAVEHNPSEPVADEHKRLLHKARAAVVEAKYTVTNRRLWQYVTNALYAALVPTMDIEVKPPSSDGKNGAVTKKAEDCSTTRDLEKAAKQIKENLGIGDGRSAGKGAKKRDAGNRKAKAAKEAEKIVALCRDAAMLRALQAALLTSGYTLAKAKAVAVATAKPAKKPAKKPATQKRAGRKPAAKQTKKAA